MCKTRELVRLPPAPLQRGVCPKSGETSLTRSCGRGSGRPASGERLTGWLEAAPSAAANGQQLGCSCSTAVPPFPAGDVGMQRARTCLSRAEQTANAGCRLAHAVPPQVLMHPEVLPWCRKYRGPPFMCLMRRGHSPKVIPYRSQAWLSASASARCHSLYCPC